LRKKLVSNLAFFKRTFANCQISIIFVPQSRNKRYTVMKKQSSTPTASNLVVAYYRVSTKRQSLGLDAQRATVEAYAAANGLTIVAEFQEKESGKEDERPCLNLAMATARKHNATLVVAKIDRISRHLSYASQIFFDSDLHVRAVEAPDNAHENELMFSVFCGMAAHEAKLISQRTKAALAAKKAQGVKLGRPGATITEEMHAASAKARKEQADTKDVNLKAAHELKRYFDGAEKRNLSAAARHLNALQLYTSNGYFQDAKSVKRLIERYAI
jgi:DNA invertase Pin-like site-specific DNA recombinase